jgi:hypothetical protein
MAIGYFIKYPLTPQIKVLIMILRTPKFSSKLLCLALKKWIDKLERWLKALLTPSITQSTNEGGLVSTANQQRGYDHTLAK